MRARGLRGVVAIGILAFAVVGTDLVAADAGAVDSTSVKVSGAVAAKLFIVHFSAGPSWDPDKPPNEQTSFGEHGRNLKRLRDEGSIVLGARYGDKGMIVLRSPSEDQARAILSADPGVVAGIFTFEVFELRTFYSGCLEVEPRPSSASSGK